MYASKQLDDAIVHSECARGGLSVATDRLQRKNAELKTLQISVAQGLRVRDKRTQGRLRQVVEAAGNDLAALVDEAFEGETDGAALTSSGSARGAIRRLALLGERCFCHYT